VKFGNNLLYKQLSYVTRKMHGPFADNIFARIVHVPKCHTSVTSLRSHLSSYATESAHVTTLFRLNTFATKLRIMRLTSK
jgi:hypothetical protein